MPNGFTPADRETVGDEMQGKRWVHQAGPCGTGLVVVEKKDMNTAIKNLSHITERYGWYMDTHVPKDEGDVLILMPITEVPDAR